MTTFNTINFFNELSAIKTKYGQRYYADEYATKQAAELWGCQSNEHGVCQPFKTETIAEAGQCRGELSYCETSKSYWLLGLSAMSSYSGIGYAPSVWHSTGYPSFDEARLAGVIKLISFFNGVISNNSSCNSKTNRENANKIIDILKSEKTPQLVLF
jgi:hypothetical protein